MFRAWEVFYIFLKLGLSSFGGPVAHLGFFHAEFVKRRRWLSEDAYADLVALCQFLPGPASSQAGFAIGYRRAGIVGALAAWVAFTSPSAVIMVAAAAGFAHLAPGGNWLHGLQIAAFAVVAQALGKMTRLFCRGALRMTLAAASLTAILLFPATWMQPCMILLCGLAGAAWLGRQEFTVKHGSSSSPPAIFPATCLCLFAALLVLLPWIGEKTGSRMIDMFAAFYQIGALVFGGGHVVLPLLQSKIAEHSWIPANEFLAGYGIAQALPGPLFSIAAFVGARAVPDFPWLAGMGCLVAIFAPSFLLLLGVLPYWEKIRSIGRLQGAFAGANAAVVGLLAAALAHPLAGDSLTSFRSALIAAAAWAALVFARMPPWLVVIGCLAAGGLLLRN